MNTGLKHAKHPQWVEDIFDQMGQPLRNRLVKTLILSLVRKDEQGFILHSFLGDHANRTPSQTREADVITAFAITEAWTAYTANDATNITYEEDEEIT